MSGSVNDLKVHIALSITSDTSWSNDAKAGELKFFMGSDNWPLLAFTAVRFYGFDTKRFSEDETEMLEVYIKLRGTRTGRMSGSEPNLSGSSRSKPQGVH